MARFGKVISASNEDPSGDRGNAPESAEQREKCVRDDLLLRLRNVCKDLPEEEFQDLVSAMTREQLRSERLH